MAVTSNWLRRTGGRNKPQSKPRGTTYAVKPKRFETAEDARHFDTYSAQNAVAAVADLTERGICDGSCVEYQDIFTFERWRAQGFQVRKGMNKRTEVEGHHQGGAVIQVWVPVDKDGDGQADYKRPMFSTVFCRHQVAPIDSEAPATVTPIKHRRAKKTPARKAAAATALKELTETAEPETVAISIPADKLDKITALLELL